MLLLSANNLRLVPSHLADNFSFHSKLPARVPFTQPHSSPDKITLEDKVYLTFTLSDGDQLVLMDTLFKAGMSPAGDDFLLHDCKLKYGKYRLSRTEKSDQPSP
jgi:hypothetical protein